MNSVSITVGGSVFSGWKEVSIRRAFNEAAATFDLSVIDGLEVSILGRLMEIREGSPCTVAIDGQTALTGYVEVRAPTYNATSHGIRLQGRSKTCDLVDCSAVVPKGAFNGYKLDAIAKRLCKDFGIGVKVNADVGKPFPKVQINQGETCWQLIERLARQRGLVCHDDEDGDLVIDQGTPGGLIGALTEGGNIKEGSATLRMDNRYSDYILKGQRPGTDKAFGKKAAQVRADATDPAVPRYRPLIIISEDPADGPNMATRADAEAARRAAESVEVQITTYGWTVAGEGGSLWEAGRLVNVTSPLLSLSGHLLAIKSAEFRQSDTDPGTVTSMTLVPPEALTPEPAKGEGGSSGGSGDGTDKAYTASKPITRATWIEG